MVAIDSCQDKSPSGIIGGRWATGTVPSLVHVKIGCAMVVRASRSCADRLHIRERQASLVVSQRVKCRAAQTYDSERRTYEDSNKWITLDL